MKHLFSLILFLSSLTFGFAQNHYDIIPKPKQLQAKSGVFEITGQTKIILPANDLERLNIAEILQYQLLTATGNKPEIANTVVTNSISFSLDKDVPEEGYKLIIDPLFITILASSPKGHFYGLQTLMQLLPPQIYSSSRQPSDLKWEVPACVIADEPRYEYRGAMLDVGRHFMPVSFVKKFIDLMAIHKLNKFHWHLTEDQGWRIEIKKYPKLTEIGSKRKETMKGHYTTNAYDGTPYGGFYTQEEIKDIVKYAASKYIEVIPEIEMPGHSLAAITAYPELGCEKKKYEVGTRWGVYDDIYCPTEKTFTFLENVLSEVIDLFPGQYIHIGGDEAPKRAWVESKFVQQLKKEQNLKDEHEVQSYFIKRIDGFITSKGKKMIGWDEILEGGISPNAIIMSWRGEEGGIAAAEAKHYAIMTPTSNVYFDYYQGDPSTEPLAIGGYLPLERVYGYNPTSEKLSKEAQKYVLGTQGNLWTEYIPTPEKAEYMLFPRLTALSEVAWTPNEAKNYEDFSNRLVTHFDRLRYKGVNYAKTYYDVSFKTGVFTRGEPVAMLSTIVKNGIIRYTVDGSQPNSSSLIYSPETSVPLTSNATVTAAVFNDKGEQLGNAISKYFAISKSTGRPYTLAHQPQGYTGGETYALSNGVKGVSGNTATWVGFNGKDLDATFDFGRANNFKKVNIAFYNAPKQWIVAPTYVEVFVSEDGKEFKSVNKTEVAASISNELSVKQLSLNLGEQTNGRYIKIVAKNYGKLPEDNPGHGNPAWLFVDEIGIE